LTVALEWTCVDIVILLGSGVRVLQVPDKTTRENRKIDRTGLEFFISIVSIPAVLPVVSVKERRVP